MGATQSIEQPYVLETKAGRLRGIEQLDRSGNAVCRRFTKIPYAAPPVGPLRWRRPQPLEDTFTFDCASGREGDYTKFGPISPQPVYGHRSTVQFNPSGCNPIQNIQDEDCLYVNIWVPAQPTPDGGWPVQFHIHGGLLQIGNACQTHETDPFDIIAQSTARIIVVPTYRLNIFGFLGGKVLAATKEDPTASNYGLWDQRCALEWTARFISHFGGNPGNITVGGHSAGASCTLYQLHYETRLLESRRLIKRVYLWSNAIAFQPSATTSSSLSSQFDDLRSVLDISCSATPADQLAALRQVPAQKLIAAIRKLKLHLFRPSTDSSFIAANFLSSLHSGAFATLLAKHNIQVFLSEVRDEARMYKLIGPPNSHSTLVQQLTNYYPREVVDALLSLYPIPEPTDQDPEKWADVYGQITADCQVHASIRGLHNALVNPPRYSDVTPLLPSNVYRYRIDWRSSSLDAWLAPSAGVCHGSDLPIWWGSVLRIGLSSRDRETELKILKRFAQFLAGEHVDCGWQDAGVLHVVAPDGSIKEDVKDEFWDRGIEIWDRLWAAQQLRA